jgi:hypothetical protein
MSNPHKGITDKYIQMMNERPQITRDELLEKLKELRGHWNTATAHYDADELLLQFIHDPEITRAFMELERWYE